MATSTPHLAGQKIRAYREKHGLTAEQFAEQVHPDSVLSAFTVYGWETNGKTARPKTINRLAEMGVCELGDWMQPAREAA